MKKTFHGPMGPVEYDLERNLLGDVRRVIVDDKEVGRIYLAGRTWLIVGLVDSPLFTSQSLAAEYLLMWKALKERSECPYCDVGWRVGPIWMGQDGTSSVVWKCPKCGAAEEHRRWPPDRGEWEEEE